MVMLGKGLAKSLNARIVGSGEETMILAHGYGADQSVWDKVLPCLANHYRVLVFDWTFSGAVKDTNLFEESKYSSYLPFADDLISLVDELNFRSSVFVGHSMSGMIGCIASVKSPFIFKRLILVGASPRYINCGEYEGGFKKSDIEHILSEIEKNFTEWATCFAAQVVDGKDPSSVSKFENCLKRMRPEVALPLARTVFLSDERGILQKVTTPCTIVQTTADAVVPRSVAHYMRRNMAGEASAAGETTLEILEADGHFPQLTAHSQFLDLLGRALGFTPSSL